MIKSFYIQLLQGVYEKSAVVDCAKVDEIILQLVKVAVHFNHFVMGGAQLYEFTISSIKA